MVIFKGFSIFFSRITGFQLKSFILIESHSLETSKNIKVGVVLGQSLGQVRSNVVKKVKKQGLSIGFFIFQMGNTLKAKSNGCTNT